MDDRDLRIFREKIKQALNGFMYYNNIKTPSDYFKIWQLTKSILEEELQAYINKELSKQLNIVQGIKQ